MHSLCFVTINIYRIVNVDVLVLDL